MNPLTTAYPPLNRPRVSSYPGNTDLQRSVNRYAQTFFDISISHEIPSLTDFDVYLIIADDPKHHEVCTFLRNLKERVPLVKGGSLVNDGWEEPFTTSRSVLVGEITSLYSQLSTLTAEARTLQYLTSLRDVFQVTNRLLPFLTDSLPEMNFLLETEISFIGNLSTMSFENNGEEALLMKSAYLDIGSFLKLAVLLKIIDKCKSTEKEASQLLDKSLQLKHQETASSFIESCKAHEKVVFFINKEENLLSKELDKCGFYSATLTHKKNRQHPTPLESNLEKLQSLAPDYEHEFYQLLSFDYLTPLLEAKEITLAIFEKRLLRRCPEWLSRELVSFCLKETALLEMKIEELSFLNNWEELSLAIKSSLELQELKTKYINFAIDPTLYRSEIETTLSSRYFTQGHIDFFHKFKN
jgi:hypothetical protein